jgi:pimeloyl-ACP methyl ester carboxylesterase
MYKNKTFFAALISVIVAVTSVQNLHAETLVTDTGYQLEYAVRGQDSTGPVSLIIMHGKNASPETVLNRLTGWADRIAQQGIRVYVPVMPWSSRWDGTHQDATSAIDALVKLAAKDGKKVVVGGHSMGAMFTIIYRPASLPPSVVGKFISAPGHLLDMIPAGTSFWQDITPSLDRSRTLEAEGKGKTKVQFGGRNTVGSSYIVERYEMTPEVYLSWHDPKRLPGIQKALKESKVPALFTVGALDPLINNSGNRQTFDLMPRHPQSAFFVLEGKDHNSSFPAAAEKLVPWLKALEK